MLVRSPEGISETKQEMSDTPAKVKAAVTIQRKFRSLYDQRIIFERYQLKNSGNPLKRRPLVLAVDAALLSAKANIAKKSPALNTILSFHSI